MGKAAGTHHINGFVIDHNADIHFFIQQIGSVFQLLLYLLPLPGVPIGNVVKFGFHIHSIQKSAFCQHIFGTAVMAFQGDARSFGVALGIAVRTFVKNTVQTISTEFLVNDDIIFCFRFLSEFKLSILKVCLILIY